MVAHLNVPNLDSRPNYPSSLSYPIVTELLKEKLGFKGLIFTDALSMKGASNFSSPGEIDLQAFLAGNDVMLMSNDVSQGIAALEKAVGIGSYFRGAVGTFCQKNIKSQIQSWAASI